MSEHRRLPGTPRWLIDAAQRGDRDAQHQLLTRYEPLVARVAAELKRPPHMTREDLAQEARIGLVAAIRAWRPERGPFPPFADRCASNQALLAVQSGFTRRQELLNHALPLEDTRRRDRIPGLPRGGLLRALADSDLEVFLLQLEFCQALLGDHIYQRGYVFQVHEDGPLLAELSIADRRPSSFMWSIQVLALATLSYHS